MDMAMLEHIARTFSAADDLIPSGAKVSCGHDIDGDVIHFQPERNRKIRIVIATVGDAGLIGCRWRATR